MIRQPRERNQLRSKAINIVSPKNKIVLTTSQTVRRGQNTATKSYIPKRSIPYSLALTWETHDLCKEMQDAVDSWRKLDPTLDVKVFDRRQREKLVEFDPKVKKAYHLVTRNSAKADIWRLAYLFLNGGFYSDIDQISHVPISRFVPNNIEFVISTRHSSRPCPIPATNNAFLGARPRCKIMQHLLYSVCENVIRLSRTQKGKKILEESKGHAITGPWIISKLLNSFVGRREAMRWEKGKRNIKGTKALFLEHLPRTGFFVNDRFVVQEKYDGYEKAKSQVQNNTYS